MQVNSNVTFNAYEGLSGKPPVVPAPLSSSTPAQTHAPEEKTLTSTGQYQAQLDSKLDNKKALDTVCQNTTINIGVGQGLPNATTGSVANSPLPLVPNASLTPGAATGISASDKFLESFSKMLEGFLANMNKMLDTFLNKISDLVGRTPAQATTPSPSTASSPSNLTPSSGTTPTPSRDLKTWEQKASEYLKGDEKGMVAESDLQEAIVKFQIYQKTGQGEAVFISELEKAKVSTTNRQSALKTALKNTVASRAISQAEADFVYSLSFKVSQFDSEVDKISTAKSTGGLSALNAIQLGAVNLSMVQAGETKPEARSIDSLT